MNDEADSPPSIGKKVPHAAWWLILAVATFAVSLLFQLLHFPSALLLGPMCAGIAVAMAGGELQVPKRLFSLAQGVVGCLIARGMPIAILSEIHKSWPLFFGGVLWAMLAATALGWLLARLRVFPGTTAIWGMSPGGAATMTIMSESYGGDMRLVAFMQYVRVVCVTFIASIVAKIWLWGVATPLRETIWFPSVAWGSFATTLVLAVGGSMLGKRLRIPAGSMLTPLALGMVAQGMGLFHIELPPWFLAVSYAIVGWCIGLRFTRQVVAQAAKAAPLVLGSTLALIAGCGLYAMFLYLAAGIDPLTAYLASSPGGVDTVAIIATASNVDVSFVMAMQTARLLLVLMTGPAIARIVARRVNA